MFRLLLFMFYCVVLCLQNEIIEEKSNIYKMELIRRKSPLEMIINGRHYKNKLKIQKKIPTNENVTMYKYLDSEYYAKIIIGKPGHEFNVIFDTTWGDMWIPSKLCSATLFPICSTKKLYDSNVSSTHKSIDPAPYNVSGLVGNATCDTVRLAHLNVTDLVFAEIREIPSVAKYEFMHADGVIGLGFKSLSQITDLPFFYKLLNDKKILKPIFSLYMNRDHTTEKGGIIFLGGIEPKHISGSITYVPVVTKAFWQIAMDQFSVRLNKTTSKTFCKAGPCQVVLDSGSNKIGVPSADVGKINNLIGAVKYLYNRYTVSCTRVKKLPTITLTFGGRDFNIGGRHYVQEIENGTNGLICLTAFTDTDLPNGLWKLGGGFLSSVYTMFDLGKSQIGFANLA